MLVAERVVSLPSLATLSPLALFYFCPRDPSKMLAIAYVRLFWVEGPGWWVWAGTFYFQVLFSVIDWSSSSVYSEYALMQIT